jgi:HK97 family phage portal protein
MALRDLFKRSQVWTPPADSDDYWFRNVGAASAAGVEVDETTAIKCAAFFACERVICEDVASLPLVVYERTGAQARERALNDHRYALLHDQPNYLMTSMGFREALTRHAVRWGNGYAWIEYQGNTGRIAALWPLRPDRMKIRRTASGQIVYRYTFAHTTPGPMTVDYLPEEILHVAGPGFDGLRGYSIISLARDSIGLALAAERFGSRLFANDARPGSVLEHPAVMSDNAYKRLKDSWEARHMGADNAHKIAILEEGTKLHEVGFPPEDIQFLQTREHQVREQCRWLRMQPHKIGDLRNATFSNIEQQSIEHVTDTIRPWCVRWEQAILLKLFGPSERKRLFAEHIMEGLLRGDFKSQAEGLHIMLQDGVINADEWREKFNMNPQADGQGKIYLAPLNMIPKGSISAVPKGGEPAPKRSLPPASPERRSGEARRRLSEVHRPLFEVAMKRMIVKERTDIWKGAQTHLGTRDNETFIDWARGYYRELNAVGIEGNELWGLYMALGETIQREAAIEVGGAIGMTDEMEFFLREYTAKYLERHAGVSMSDIMAAVGRPDGDPLELLKLDLDKWDTRPEIDARWEAHRAANAVARETWRSEGITHIRWQTSGENCPYCNQLNGRVVGIEGTFATKGEHLQDPENPNNWMSFSSDFHHPPIHAGCDCSVTAA